MEGGKLCISCSCFPLLVKCTHHTCFPSGETKDSWITECESQEGFRFTERKTEAQRDGAPIASSSRAVLGSNRALPTMERTSVLKVKMESVPG